MAGNQYVQNARVQHPDHTDFFQHVKERLLLVDFIIKPKRKLYKQEYQQQGCEGGALLVELGNITDLDGVGFDGFYLDGVGILHNSVFVGGMPFL